MAQFSKTWWGKRFIKALENFSDYDRLVRGRSYARNGKVRDYQINQGLITAQVQGSINPYFGVYKEPLYHTTIEIQPISAADWSKVILYLGSKASLISKLLLGEVPDNIETAFAHFNLHLLPQSRQDFQTSCSCPDWGNPCKHIAGVYYLVAAQLDQDPFLLFELRGISRRQLLQKLAKSPLGKTLAGALENSEFPPQIAESYYTRPQTLPMVAPMSAQDFWLPQKQFLRDKEVGTTYSLPALQVKKGGDYPPFWQQDASFLEVMEDLYERVRTKNKGLF